MKKNKIIDFINTATIINTYKKNIIEENGIVFSLIKNTELTINNIGVYINNRNSYKQFSSFLTLLEIETIIQPLLAKHQLFSTEMGELTYTLNFSMIEPELFEKTLNTSCLKMIKTEQDIIDLLNDLKEYTEKIAEPFFEKWSDLRVLDKFLDTVPQTEVHKYLGGYGVFSKILIYKLCNNPNYKDYFDMMYSFAINRHKENPNGDIAIKQKHDFMIDFKVVLDGIDPIYNI